MHATFRRRSDPALPLALGLAAISWAILLLLFAIGGEELVSHDAIVGHEAVPGLLQLVLFVAVWQLMTAAMMLPSSLAVMALFARASRAQPHRDMALAIFLAAYFGVWTGFAVAALFGDGLIHRGVDAWPWLDERPWLVQGSVLLLAGGFQFSPLKERCLTACRNPVQYLFRHYGRGLRAAAATGLRHALFCLGCCWALMLLMFALGVGNIAWMAALAAVMIVEKSVPGGRRLAPVVGVVLLVMGVLTLAHLSWLPIDWLPPEA